MKFILGKLAATGAAALILAIFFGLSFVIKPLSKALSEYMRTKSEIIRQEYFEENSRKLED